MKTFAIALLSIAAQAATPEEVHEFFAERNTICELCKTTVQLWASEDWDAVGDLFTKMPAIQDRLFPWYTYNNDVIDFKDPLGSCQRMQSCGVSSVSQLMEGERQIDLQSHIDTVNSDPTSTWIAGNNGKFGVAPNFAQVQGLMGSIVDPEWLVDLESTTYEEAQAVTSPTLVSDEALPTDFDARVQFPACETTIDNVRDQSNCGSCWAFGTTEAFNDRYCIAAGKDNPTNFLSTADTTGCCNGLSCFSFGCNGGQVGTPWNWFTKTGVVSGGSYASNNMLCYNYTMPDCNHHQPTSTLPECDTIKQVQPTCPTDNKCPSTANMNYEDNKVKAATSYGFSGLNVVRKVKKDIAAHGSVTGAFTVYEDFLTYKSGVYEHKTGAALGGHAIKVIGWGNDNGVDYWLCVNSWNRTWGDNGLFKIKQGDCGIDKQMHAGLVNSQ